MRAGTKLFLFLGCVCVLALEVPRTLSDLSSGWRGPYARSLLPTLLPTDELEFGLWGARTVFAQLVGSQSVWVQPDGAQPDGVQSIQIPVPRPRGRLELARR